MSEKTFGKREKAAAALLFLANLVFCLTVWIAVTYDEVKFDQFLFQFKAPSTGIHRELSLDGFLHAGVFPAALTALEVWLLHLSAQDRTPKRAGRAGKLPGRLRAAARAVRQRALPIACVLLAASAAFFCVRLKIFGYVKASAEESELFRAYYVEPDGVRLRFPEKKRNLVYIFLESMESTYADAEAGGEQPGCIPELKALAEENVSFSDTDGAGGALSFPGTTWTAAAMVAQTSGSVVKVSLDADTYGSDGCFMPGVTSIGEILQRQGYTQVLLLGSDAQFHGREAYFSEHGDYTILDTRSLKAAGRLSEDYSEWWGFEDEKLFAYAREELARLYEAGAPFNLTLLTADTHFPDGCRCRLCEDGYGSPYANVLACSSRQVAAFVSWIREQPFYEDTAIVICGDHLTMDADFAESLDPDVTRTVYDCFINPAVQPAREKGRLFGAFDLFPTTLAAMGVEIEGGRLGLGTDLFSGRDTLTERLGYDYLCDELQKHSDFYDTQLLGIED